MVFTLNDSLIIDNTGNVGIGTMPKSSFDISLTSTALTIPSGNTLQRINNEGMFRFNTETELYELYTLGSWSSFTLAPSIASVSTQVLKNANDSLVVSGSSLLESAQWRLIGNSKKQYIPKTITHTSNSSVTLVRPDLLPISDAPYQIQCRQMGKVAYFSPITVGNTPVFVTSGGLTTTGGAAITPFVVVVNDEDSGGITNVSITSGSLPPGLVGEFTTVGVNGKYTISGTPSSVTLTTTYPITLTATDLGNNVVSQSYNIVVDSTTLYNSFTTAIKTSVMVAFSLRKVNPGYTGAVVKVRRSSDNIENDFFGTSTGALTNSTGTSISSWLGAATGYVSIWYDQSGVGRNATQATASYQPILNLTQFTFPTIHFNSSSQTDQKYLLIGNLTVTAPFTFIFTSRVTRSGRWIAHSTTSPNTLMGHWSGQEASFYMDGNPGGGTGNANTLSRYNTVYNQDYINMAGKSTTSLDYYFINGSLRHDTIAGTATNFGNSIMLGGGHNTSEYAAGYFMELIINNVMIPRSELNVIQSNIQTFYNITTVPIDLPISTTLEVGSGTWRVLYEVSNPLRNSSTALTFDVNNATAFAGKVFTRIGYFMQNKMGNGATIYWILVTMDAYTSSLATLKIPDGTNAFTNKTNTSNLKIYSNHPQVGRYNVANGRVEIWPYDYNNATTIGDGSASTYDIDDTPSTTGGYGSVQVHDIVNKTTLLGWNNHASGGTPAIGIGNNVSGNSHYASAGAPDWTFANNGAYNWKFQVLILEPNPSPTITSATPSTITQNTASALYTTSYTFTGTASAGSITWSITPTTFGNINPSTGALTLTFPQGTAASGTFAVTATDTNGSVTQSWTYSINAASIPNDMGLWLDASDITTVTMDGLNKVSEWRDKSTNNRNFTQLNTSRQPTFSSSGFGTFPAIVLGQSTISMGALANTMGSLSSSTTLTIFCLAKSRAVPFSIVLSNWLTSTYEGGLYRVHFGHRADNVNLTTLYVNGTEVARAGTTNTNGLFISGFAFAGQNVQSQVFTNGVSTNFTPSVALVSTLASSTSSWFIGDPRPDYSCQSVAEIIAYPRYLSISEQQQVMNFLNTKYAVY